MSERELVANLVRKLKRDGFRVMTEVSNMGQSADIVAIKGRWVTLIEVKNQHWNRAIQQCRAHEHVADYICIAVASVSVPRRLAELVTQAGYGLLHYSRAEQEFAWVVKPRLNRRVWRPQRQHWSRSRRRIAYAD